MRSTKRALVAAAFALVTFATIVSADSAVSQSGTIGKYNVIDSATKPGAICSAADNIGPTGVRIDVPGPKVWAVDKTAGLDTQGVGWRFVVMYKVNGEWHVMTRSVIFKSNATDATAHTFAPSLVQVSSGSPKYRIRESIFWYGQFGIQTGKVTREVEYYRQGTGAGDPVLGPNGDCHPFV